MRTLSLPDTFYKQLVGNWDRKQKRIYGYDLHMCAILKCWLSILTPGNFQIPTGQPHSDVTLEYRFKEGNIFWFSEDFGGFSI